MKRRALLGAAALLVARGVRAGSAIRYPDVVPGRALAFPRDHGAHADYRIEWWYVTGQLADSAADRYGFQVTFFRSRPGVAEDNPSRFAARQLIIAHAALADVGRSRLLHDERVARVAFDLAGADESDLRTWIGDWSLVRDGDPVRARIAARDFALALVVAPTQPILLQGDSGYSRKGPDARQASYYYSWPQLAVHGRIAVGGTWRDVSGSAWLDHEWSTAPLADGASGWDWLGANLDDGGALMAFVMRDRSGRPLWAAATLRTRNGERRDTPAADVRFMVRRRWRSPRTGIDYPVAVDVWVGGRVFALEPWFDDQEQDARASTGTIYWEGAVRVSVDGREQGRGYLELTGYGAPLRL
jgi:predicted secreted hydrolase